MSALLEVQKKMQGLPGGMNGAMIIFVVVLASIDEKTLNVSTISNQLGMDRKTVRRVLDTLVAGGYIERRDDILDWPVYTRNCTPEVHEWSRRWCNEVYEIIKHRLRPFCSPPNVEVCKSETPEDESTAEYCAKDCA
jgi:predicted transcriptional regulator